MSIELLWNIKSGETSFPRKQADVNEANDSLIFWRSK